MDPAENAQQKNIPGNKARKRPLLCSAILTLALTYFLVITLLFLAALIFSGDILRALSHYYIPEDFKAGRIIVFIVTGGILYFSASTGIILFLLGRRSGFYLFFLTALVIFILDFIFLDFDWIRYLLQSGFIFLLGIMHFSKRCYTVGKLT